MSDDERWDDGCWRRRVRKGWRVDNEDDERHREKNACKKDDRERKVDGEKDKEDDVWITVGYVERDIGISIQQVFWLLKELAWIVGRREKDAISSIEREVNCEEWMKSERRW